MQKLRQCVTLLRSVAQATASLAATSSGFTMIELLVVIAVIGILAVAVLSSINPIEQINKGRDTRTRSDAAQLINAVDRYFAIQEYYPWNYTSSTWTAPDDDYISEYEQAPEGGAAAWTWADVLVGTEEVKQGFVNRLVSSDNLYLYKASGSNATMYACYKPTSHAFQFEAAKNCLENATPDTIGTVTACVTTDGTVDPDNLICLP